MQGRGTSNRAIRNASDSLGRLVCLFRHRSKVGLHVGEVVVHGLRQVIGGLIEIAVYISADLHRHTVKFLSILSHSRSRQLKCSCLIDTSIYHGLRHGIASIDAILGQLLSNLSFALTHILGDVKLGLCCLHLRLKYGLVSL